MLYDPKWEVEVKSDPFSLESLIAWLEKQPADQEYDWSKAGNCLLGQWCASQGLSGDELFAKSIALGNFHSGNEPFSQVALGDLEACTFGAALERARALA